MKALNGRRGRDPIVTEQKPKYPRLRLNASLSPDGFRIILLMHPTHPIRPDLHDRSWWSTMAAHRAGL